MTEMSFDRDAIVATFLAETEEGLDAMEQALVALETHPDDAEMLNVVFRATHTLKGNALSLGFDALVRVAHVLEDLLDALRHKAVPLTTVRVTLVLHAVDALRDLTPLAVAGNADLSAAHKELLRQLSLQLHPAASGDDLAAGAALPEPETPRAGNGRRADHLSLRLDMEKLDRMLDLTGEIAIARGRLRRILDKAGGELAAEMLEAFHHSERLSRDLQELVMQARLVPLEATFRHHVRTVRDLATARSKQARLLVEGEHVEVDAAVVEHVRDPLLHMIRNAVDHGIENPEARREAGKDPCGTIWIRARHESSTIVIEVGDDGAGLDGKRIVEKARARGLDPETMSEEQLARLIFEPGFSTAATVTEVSGRGVGLDVVRRNIHALRGTVGVTTREGQGTTVSLRLPLTLAIIDGFGVGVAGTTYFVPLDSVVECVDLAGRGLRCGERDGVLDVHGEALPYLRLRRLFGDEGIAEREHMVIVQGDGGRVGLVADELYGEGQIVVKPLGRLFQDVSGVAGSAILGNGRVALILDVPGLLREALDEMQEEAGRPA